MRAMPWLARFAWRPGPGGPGRGRGIGFPEQHHDGFHNQPDLQPYHDDARDEKV